MVCLVFLVVCVVEGMICACVPHSVSVVFLSVCVTSTFVGVVCVCESVLL